MTKSVISRGIAELSIAASPFHKLEMILGLGLDDLHNIEIDVFDAAQSETRLLDVADRIPIETGADAAGQRGHKIHEDAERPDRAANVLDHEQLAIRLQHAA